MALPRNVIAAQTRARITEALGETPPELAKLALEKYAKSLQEARRRLLDSSAETLALDLAAALSPDYTPEEVIAYIVEVLNPKLGISPPEK